MERDPSKETSKIPTYEVDLSETWDTTSKVELLIEEVKKSGVYKPDLRYCGFNAEDLGKERAVVFGSTEKEMLSEDGGEENAMHYALEKENPVIALYDFSKLERAGVESGLYGYKIKDPSALIAVIKLKGG